MHNHEEDGGPRDGATKEGIEVAEPSGSAPESACPGSEHEQLSSQLEQQVRTIASCFRLKAPRSTFSPSEWLVLSALAEGTYSLKDLSQKVLLSISSTSQVTRRLSLLGLIVWKRTKLDRRNYTLSITPQGSKVHALTREEAVRDNATCFSGLSADELRVLILLLGKCMPSSRREQSLDPPSEE